MLRTVRYLTHPQVAIDPSKPVRTWSLNDVGKRRIRALAASNALDGTQKVISSRETKAIETASPLANSLNCPLEIRDAMHENDRSATGFLPPEEFEIVADQFFADPGQSIRGWETANSAQSRIVGEFKRCISGSSAGDILFVGHGGVGTLLFCYLCDVPISREFDQGSGGGGCFFECEMPDCKPKSRWQPMENLTG